MDVLDVHRLQARYRLAPSSLGERARLDRVLDGLLADALAAAAAAAGLDESDELCVRRVDTSVRLPANAPDGDVARVWAAALVEAVARSLRGGGVVRYRSRRHALLDLAVSVARRDTTRAWAWRQLGLWDSRPSAGDRDALERLVSALLADPEAIVAVLAAVARDGDALAALARRFEPLQWQTLSAAALVSAGARPEGPPAAAPAARRGLSAIASSSAGTIGDVAGAALHVVRRSEIARALLRGAAAALGDPTARRAVAAVALLEVDPAATRNTARRAGLLDAIGDALDPAGAESTVPATGEPAGRADETGKTAKNGARPEARDTHGAEAPSATPPDVHDEAGARHPDGEDDREPPPVARSNDVGAAAAAGSARAAAEDDDANACATEPAGAQRARAWTHAGGLLFLLNVLDELELGDAIAQDDVLAERPFRWSLHRLALQLAPVGAEDPAALAFAGLAPDADPPTVGEEPPTDAELQRVVAYADAVVERLRERLERPDDPTLVLLDAVCRRRAEIVADPGWIEARFSAEDADVELRRAALDLDPGWLPWLGAVVVFTYA